MSKRKSNQPKELWAQLAEVRRKLDPQMDSYARVVRRRTARAQTSRQELAEYATWDVVRRVASLDVQPTLCCCCGRELVGETVEAPEPVRRLVPGSVVPRVCERCMVPLE